MRDKKKLMTAEQVFVYALRALGHGSAYVQAPILQHLRTGPLPTFQIPSQPFKRRGLESARQRARRGGNYRQLQRERYKNPALMAAQRASHSSWPVERKS